MREDNFVNKSMSNKTHQVITTKKTLNNLTKYPPINKKNLTVTMEGQHLNLMMQHQGTNPKTSSKDKASTLQKKKKALQSEHQINLKSQIGKKANST